MSRQDVVRVTCDVCGRTLDVRPDEAEATRYTVPMMVIGECARHVRQFTVDLCNRCVGKMAIIEAHPITEMRYDPTAYETRPFPTGHYTYRFSGEHDADA